MSTIILQWTRLSLCFVYDVECTFCIQRDCLICTVQKACISITLLETVNQSPNDDFPPKFQYSNFFKIMMRLVSLFSFRSSIMSLHGKQSMEKMDRIDAPRDYIQKACPKYHIISHHVQYSKFHTNINYDMNEPCLPRILRSPALSSGDPCSKYFPE